MEKLRSIITDIFSVPVGSNRIEFRITYLSGDKPERIDFKVYDKNETVLAAGYDRPAENKHYFETLAPIATTTRNKIQKSIGKGIAELIKI